MNARPLVAGLTAGLTAALTAGLLAAVPPLAMAADTPSPGPSLVGGSPATWTPLNAKRADSGATIRMVPQQALLFPDFSAKAHFTSSNTRVFTVSDAEGTGPVTAVAGGQAVAPGRATVTVTRDGRTVAHYTIVVTARTGK